MDSLCKHVVDAIDEGLRNPAGPDEAVVPKLTAQVLIAPGREEAFHVPVVNFFGAVFFVPLALRRGKGCSLFGPPPDFVPLLVAVLPLTVPGTQCSAGSLLGTGNAMLGAYSPPNASHQFAKLMFVIMHYTIVNNFILFTCCYA